MKHFIVKTEEVSAYGKNPGSRKGKELLDLGFVVIDKPAGISSNDLVIKIKKKFGVDKAGQSGTLDPNATGVLVVVLGNGTKVMPTLMGLDKEYRATVHLHKDVGNDELRKILKKFTGKIKQVPPVKSAVKREEREREIYELELLKRKGKDVRLRVFCQAGTYIRKLASDMGKEMGGAHLKTLRRTKVGPFTLKDAVKLKKLKKKDVKPVEQSVEHVKAVIIKDSAVEAVCNGAPLYKKGITKVEKGIEKGNLVTILTLKGELVALGKAQVKSEQMVKARGLAVNTNRVLMKKGTYPKGW